jgi:prepilin-type N-terminal cleavage/methylation domain-containing protein
MRRLGYTLVELLVAIAIVSILVALLLPAVQSVRESASTTACRNNLRQIACGTLAHHDARRWLPASKIHDHYASWAVQLLPFVGQESLYSRWDMALPYYLQSDEARSGEVAIYLCPSRRRGCLSTSGDVPDNGVPSRNHYPGAIGDYAGCAGNWQYAGLADGVNANGAIVVGNVLAWAPGGLVASWRGRVTLASIIDGTSNTLLFGEKHVPQENLLSAPGDGSIYNGDHEWNFVRVAGRGYPINEPGNVTRWTFRFGGPHRGVCLFAFCDGSVAPLATGTNMATLGALASRNGGD